MKGGLYRRGWDREGGEEREGNMRKKKTKDTSGSESFFLFLFFLLQLWG
jgi:hypothetical protein